MTLITKWTYGEYSSDNYGAHTQCLNVGVLRFYFSYNTVVAFRTPKEGFVISENVWSRTTGKHLNWLNPDKSVRIPNSEFNKRLTRLLKEYKLDISNN